MKLPRLNFIGSVVSHFYFWRNADGDWSEITGEQFMFFEAFGILEGEAIIEQLIDGDHVGATKRTACDIVSLD